MSSDFLNNFLRFAHTITNAERGLVVDGDFSVCGMIALDADTIESDEFNDIASEAMRQAREEKSAIITNNIITDPEDAPITNTNFRNLRIIVTFPVGELGTIYLDQLLRRGVMTSDTLEQLMAFAQKCINEGHTNLSANELLKRYESDASS
jgi:hypothetical protein